MARLRTGEKDQKQHSIHNLLHRHDNGLTEQEIAEMTGMDRRRLNNYLRDLPQDQQKAYRERRLWFGEDDLANWVLIIFQLAVIIWLGASETSRILRHGLMPRIERIDQTTA